jgi:hypothetical protein
MQHRDLILREIQRLARLLARLIGLKEEGRRAEASALADEACRELSGLDSALLTALPDGVFLERIQGKELKDEQIEMLADILAVEGEMLRQQNGNSELSRLRFHKAILLLDHLTKVRKQFSFKREDKISRLSAWLKEAGTD